MSIQSPPSGAIKVKRDGPRGWHWIAAASYDPARHELHEDAAEQPPPPAAASAPAQVARKPRRSKSHPMEP